MLAFEIPNVSPITFKKLSVAQYRSAAKSWKPLCRDFNCEFLKLDFKRQLDFSLSENIMCDLHIHHFHKSNNTNESKLMIDHYSWYKKCPILNRNLTNLIKFNQRAFLDVTCDLHHAKKVVKKTNLMSLLWRNLTWPKLFWLRYLDRQVTPRIQHSLNIASVVNLVTT